MPNRQRRKNGGPKSKGKPPAMTRTAGVQTEAEPKKDEEKSAAATVPAAGQGPATTKPASAKPPKKPAVLKPIEEATTEEEWSDGQIEEGDRIAKQIVEPGDRHETICETHDGGNEDLCPKHLDERKADAIREMLMGTRQIPRGPAAIEGKSIYDAAADWIEIGFSAYLDRFLDPEEDLKRQFKENPPKEGEYFVPAHKLAWKRLDLARFIGFPDNSAMDVHAVTQPLAWLRKLNADIAKMIAGYDDVKFTRFESQFSGEKTVRMTVGQTRLDFEIIPLKYKKMEPSEDFDVDRLLEANARLIEMNEENFKFLNCDECLFTSKKKASKENHKCPKKLVQDRRDVLKSAVEALLEHRNYVSSATAQVLIQICKTAQELFIYDLVRKNQDDQIVKAQNEIGEQRLMAQDLDADVNLDLLSWLKQSWENLGCPPNLFHDLFSEDDKENQASNTNSSSNPATTGATAATAAGMNTTPADKASKDYDNAMELLDEAYAENAGGRADQSKIVKRIEHLQAQLHEAEKARAEKWLQSKKIKAFSESFQSFEELADVICNKVTIRNNKLAAAEKATSYEKS